MYTQDQIITAMPAAGYTVVLGAAGSGKSAAALKRAAFFCRKAGAPAGPARHMEPAARVAAADAVRKGDAAAPPDRGGLSGFCTAQPEILRRDRRHRALSGRAPQSGLDPAGFEEMSGGTSGGAAFFHAPAVL